VGRCVCVAVIPISYEKTWLCVNTNLTCILSFCSLFKSYKPECVPEKVPAVNLHLAFKAVGKMNQFFQQAQLRLNAGSSEETCAKMVKWNIDQGLKKVSEGASMLNNLPPSPYIGA
jgi:hypothetical protein